MYNKMPMKMLQQFQSVKSSVEQYPHPQIPDPRLSTLRIYRRGRLSVHFEAWPA